MQVSNRVFVISLYLPDEQNRLVAEVPKVCPNRDHDGEKCRIRINHYRQRKTGPCFPLTVVECRTHALRFTLYPPGHVPYGRHPLNTDITITGENITFEVAGPSPADVLPAVYQNSFFEAALAANSQKIWLEESMWGSLEPRFITQLRQLDRALRLLGLHSELTPRQIEEITEILDLSGQRVADGRSRLGYQPTVKYQGQVICQLLKAIPYTQSLFERLAHAGSTAKLWPIPHFWNGITGRLKNRSFHPTGIRGSP